MILRALARSQRRKTMSMNFNRLSTDDKILIMEGAQVLGDVVAGEGTALSLIHI